eukprot:gene8475-8658_t
MQVNLLGPTASVVAQQVGVVEADLGLVFTVNGIASIVGGLPSGWVVDRLPGHAVLAAALAFEAAGFVLIPFSESMLALAATFGAVALSWNIINTAGNTYVLWIGSVFNFLNVGTEVAYGAWVFTYTVKQAQLSDHIGHFLNAAYWGSFTIGRVIASFAAAALQPTTILLCSLPLAVLGAATALLAPLTVAGSVWLLLTVSLLIGLGASAGFANSLALLDKYHPCTGSVTGWLGGVAGAGCMTIPFLISVLAKYTMFGYQGLMNCIVS